MVAKPFLTFRSGTGKRSFPDPDSPSLVGEVMTTSRLFFAGLLLLLLMVSISPLTPFDSGVTSLLEKHVRFDQLQNYWLPYATAKRLLHN
jgi:hypothetical protein